jgi:hypothetical protein
VYALIQRGLGATLALVGLLSLLLACFEEIQQWACDMLTRCWR